ncbi:hemagglutinin repeat-containing protein [Cupriavidus sp. 2SB]|uniref:two-partner secretion domain-containing protein n=1 Tax=Cupriavidus sp. 2SB TaxID=2502199 RepID=UPI0010F9FD6B|nr:hemagglutinin repeat-containing protein [Cupriavidus sp. 2SB]
MNKRLYRIVFVLGQVSLVTTATAQIVADPNAPGQQRPTVLTAPNGTPLVNIQTPSAAGVSRNAYSQFDVQERGAILNNARQNAQTQLGGWVQGNPWLSGGTARVILNEVNSSNPSQLRGYTEVAGDRAQIVIANPAGITCDGCGFLNANRVTMTTGTPIVNGGSLEGYRVRGGGIDITGAGLDASRVGYTDLLARAVRVNAGIWAEDLKVATGAHDADATLASITPASGSGSAPAYALDVSALGGMYAGKIALIGTEHGVGMRNVGHIGAQAGELSVTSDGRLENTGVLQAMSDARIAAVGVRNAGTMMAGATLAVTVGEAIDNRGGALYAADNVELRGSTVANGDDGFVASSRGSIDIATQHAVDNAGGTLQAAKGRLGISASTLHNVEGSVLGADVDIDTRSGELGNTAGRIAALDGALDIRSGALDNNAGLLQASVALHVDTSGQGLTNDLDGHIGSAGSLSIAAGYLENAGTIVADGRADIDTDWIGNKGTVQAHGLVLRTTYIDNLLAGVIEGGTTTIVARNTLFNEGLIDGGFTRVESDYLYNFGSARLYSDRLAIQARQLFNNKHVDDDKASTPTIAAREQLDIGAGEIINRDQGLIFSGGTLNIGGALDEDGYATGRADYLSNTSATIESLGDMSLATESLRNTDHSFRTERVQVGDSVRRQTVQPQNDPNQYDLDTLQWESWSRAGRYRGKADADSAIAGQPIQNYTDYDFTETRSVDRVTQSTPAIIRAGGSIDIDGEDLLNAYSQIMAGGALTGEADKIENRDAVGYEVIRRVGTSQYTYGRWRGGVRRYTTRERDPRIAYTPADEYRAFDLGLAVIRANHQGEDSGNGIEGRRANGDTRVRLIDIATTGSDDPSTVRTIDFRPEIPSGSLFRPGSGTHLIETDARFTDYRQWLSSDSMLDQLGIDPEMIEKRLGDGFYEQQLVREQIGQLTGRRFLDGYRSDEAQYRALLANGVTVARDMQLRPGVALTAAQIAQLTSDIVWLVEQRVTLPDGTTATALVPQVYVRTKPGDLKGDGTLIAANVVDLSLRGDLSNTGTIAGRRAIRLVAENVQNLGGRITGDAVGVQAREDIENTGGTIDAGSALRVVAARDLRLASTTRSSETQSGQNTFSRTNVDRVAGLYVSKPGATLTALAGRDMVLDGAQISNTGKAGKTVIAAGRDLTLGTVRVGVQEDNVRNAGNALRQGSTQEIGTSIRTNGDVTLSAERDLRARAAQVTSDAGALLAVAGRNTTLTAGENTSNWSEDRDQQRSGLLGSSRTTTRDSLRETTSLATTFSGSTVELHAGQNIDITGSNVVSDLGTRVVARGTLSIEAAQNTTTESHFKETKKSGFLYSGGTAFTIGTQQQNNDARSTRTTAAASTIGVTQGDVTLIAGDAYRQTGSHVVAPKGDIGIFARKGEIVEAREASQSTEESRFRQSGLTMAVTAPAIALIETAQQMKRAGGNTSDTRMQALAGATTALAAKNAADAVMADPSSGGGVGLSITVGSSQNQSRTTNRADVAARSTVAAGGNVRIMATGNGQDSELTIRGAEVRAGEDLHLKAEGKVHLLGAENVSDMRRQSKSSNVGMGVGFQAGQGGTSFGVTASASGSRGKGEGTDRTWTHSRVDAGQTLKIESGGDTELNGAVARGRMIDADIGGHLQIGSLQDIHDYRSKDQSAGGSVTVGGGFSGSANIGQQKIDGRYASVTEQSGLKAGDGGFNIRVKGNTSLDGGVITSTRKAAEEKLNRLDTRTLTTGDIDNKASYTASSVSIGGGFASKGSSKQTGGDDGSTPGSTAGGVDTVGTNQQGQAATGGDKVPGSSLPSMGGFSAAPPVAIGAKGKSSSTTHSGISDAAITIRDTEAQQALTGKSADDTLAELNRDVSSEVDGSNALKPIFNEKEIKAGFEIVGALQRETGAFLNNRAKEADAIKLARDKETDPARRAELDQQYEDAAKWGPGGTYRRITTALTAAAGGNVTGSTTQFVQGAAVGYLQGLGATGVKQIAAGIGDGTPGAESARAALHAIVGCAGAAAASQSCSAGAMGAATSSVVGSLMAPADGLTNEQKQARLDAMRSLVAGIASVGDIDAGTAANAATIEGENNQFAPRPNPQNNGGIVGGGGKTGQPLDPFKTPARPADPGEATVMGQPDKSGANGAKVLIQPVWDLLEDGVERVKNPLYIPLKVVEGLGAIFSEGKSGQDAPRYAPTEKHARGGWGTPMDLDDRTAQEVLNNSIQDGKQRYGIKDGKIYEFQPDNVGGWHGYPIPGKETSADVLREFVRRGDLSKSQYGKSRKGK